MKKIVIAFIVVLFFNFLLTPIKAYAVGASLLLSPATYSSIVGDPFTVDILVDTGGVATTNRIKAVITYDTAMLQVVDSDTTTVGTQIEPGPIFVSAPSANTVDSVTGKITYDSGVVSPAYSGHGVLATITFKGLKSGITRPPFVFNSSTITSPDGSNILEVVNDGTYTLTDGTGDTTTTTTFDSSTTEEMPQSGVVENTLAILGVGVLFIFLSFGIRRISR